MYTNREVITAVRDIYTELSLAATAVPGRIPKHFVVRDFVPDSRELVEIAQVHQDSGEITWSDEFAKR